LRGGGGVAPSTPEEGASERLSDPGPPPCRTPISSSISLSATRVSAGGIWVVAGGEGVVVEAAEGEGETANAPHPPRARPLTWPYKMAASTGPFPRWRPMRTRATSHPVHIGGQGDLPDWKYYLCSPNFPLQKPPLSLQNIYCPPPILRGPLNAQQDPKIGECTLRDNLAWPIHPNLHIFGH